MDAISPENELRECFRNVYKSDWNVNPHGAYWTVARMEEYLRAREAQIAANEAAGRDPFYGIGVEDYSEPDIEESKAEDALSFSDWMDQRAELLGV